MTRNIKGNPATSDLKSSVFSSLAARLSLHRGPTYPLHVGDTYLSPIEGAHLSDQAESVHPSVHRYIHPRGLPELITQIVQSRNTREPDYPITEDHLLVTAGATGALSATVRALLTPGDSIMLLGPRWPLIRGMSSSHNVTPVEVPFYDRISGPEAVIPLLETAILPSTSAIYVNWPNNPTGLIPNREVVSEIVEFAVKHDLWILSDEVYEKILFESSPVNLFSFPEARKRTVRVFSFSKAFGMAGNRVGYLVSDPQVTALISRLTTYLIYSVSTGGQWAACKALNSNVKWSQQAAGKYLEVAQKIAERLRIPVPQGGTFFFMDVAEHLDESGIMGLLNSCVDEGLLLAPGAAFGPDYQDHIRLCFTSVPPEQTLTGVEILARKLGL